MAPRLKKDSSGEGSNTFTDLLRRHRPEYALREFRTGVLAVDFAAGPSRSFERGDSVLLWSEEGYGKSTVLMQIARNLSEIYGERSVYIDPEGGAKKLFMHTVSLDNEDILYMSPEQGLCYARDIYKFLMELFKLPDYPLHIFLDSLNKLKPHPEDVLDKKTGAPSDMLGTEAKETKRFFDLFQPMCKQKGVTLWVIAQARANIDISNPNASKYNPTKVGASHAAKHAQDVVIQFKGRPSSTGNFQTSAFFGIDGATGSRREGREFFIYPSKNRGGYAHYSIPVALRFGSGISNMHFRTRMLEWAGAYVGGASGHYKLMLPGEDERAFRGADAFFLAYMAEKELRVKVAEYCEQLEASYYDYLTTDPYVEKRK